MVQEIFGLDFLEYRNKLRKSILDSGIGELVVNPNLNGSEIEAYCFPKLKTTLFYWGSGVVTILGYNDIDLRHTKSRLEQLSGVKLTEINKNG